MMTNPLANQSRLPRPYPYRYFVCVSSAWLVLRARVVANTDTAVPVLPEAILDKESPAGEWVLQRALALMSAPTAQPMLFAYTTKMMANILDDICDDGPALSAEMASLKGVSKATVERHWQSTRHQSSTTRLWRCCCRTLSCDLTSFNA